MLSSWQGRLALILLSLMAAVSIYALSAYPLDYGPRVWNNPSIWAEYPKAVPPAWSSSGSDFTHTILRPEKTLYSAENLLIREERLLFGSTRPPTGITLKFGEITFLENPPVIEVFLKRPDEVEIRLAAFSPSGPRPGEEPPHARYVDQPLRIFPATSRSVQGMLAQKLSERYGVYVSEEDVSQRFEEYLFSKPLVDGRLEPLMGEYIFRLQFYRESSLEDIGVVEIVLAGSVYGFMGTDALGRDLAQGLLFGFPVSLSIGLLAAGVTTLIGASLGLFSGYAGGRTDNVIQRAADVVANIPLLPILILLAYTFRPGLLFIILFLTLFSWPGLTILVRSMVIQLRNSPMVDAAKSIGAGEFRIIARHIAPNVAPYVLGQMILSIPSAILAEAGLSFLGLGDPQIPTWGSMLEQAFRTGAIFVGYWWWVIPPGLLIALTSTSFILLALSLEPALNPRLAARLRRGGRESG
ncbi:MAG: ABC transporter permease [Aigarchaeota archaeon]|nr:ABC transporter permease [Candidatus Calditenuaceae archaeon]